MGYINQFIYPKKIIGGRFLNFILNNILFIKIKRVLFYPFSRAKLKSDVKNVVYLNWLVPLHKIEHLIPPHIKVMAYEGNVLLTVLTYNHGNFRPASLSLLKNYFASPLQSNWRLYVANTPAFQLNDPTVYFVKNIMSDFTYAIGSRVFSNILHSHLPESFEHSFNSDQLITKIVPGQSNSPDLQFTAKITPEWNISQNIKSIFPNTNDLINMICNQHFAISDQPDKNKYSIAGINLRFDFEKISPLKIIDLRSKWLGDIVSDSDCFAFLIPELTFTTLKEKLLTITQ